MDKYEYNLKLDEIKNLYKDSKFEAAAKVADGINWNKVKNVNILVKVGEIYEKLGRLEDAREILILAYNRSPLGRNIIYKLAKLALKLNDIESANEYYDEFVEIGPNDVLKFALKYEIKRATGATTEELIPILESLKEHEYTEEWAYELAYLYHKANMVQKCVAACDELILWFGDGPYVERALELKILYHPLTKKQEEKYKKFHLDDKKIQKIEELVDQNELPEATDQNENKENEEKYDTDSLKKSLEDYIEQIKKADNRDQIEENLDNIKKLVVDMPYLKVVQIDDEILKKTKNIETDEEIDGSLKLNFKELLSEESEGKINITKSEDESENEQLSIDDILGKWEKTKRAAETALKNAEEKKLNSSRARALAVAEDILKRLNEVIPKLEEGHSPKELLEREYLKDKYDLIEAAREHNLGIELDPDKIKQRETVKEQKEIKKAIEAERAVSDIYNSDINETPVTRERAEAFDLSKDDKVETNEFDEQEQSENDSLEKSEENVEENLSVSAESINEVINTESSIETEQNEESTVEENVSNEDKKVNDTDVSESKENNFEEESVKEEISSKDDSVNSEENSIEDVEKSESEEELSEEDNNDSSENEADKVENIGEEAWNGICNILSTVFKSNDNEDIEQDTVNELLDKNDEIADKTGVLVDFDSVKSTSNKKDDNTEVKDNNIITEETKPMPTREELEEEIKKQLSEKKAERSKLVKKETELVEELTKEQKSIFSYFVPIKGMEKQLCQVLTGLKERLKDNSNANERNLIVQGTRGCGKTVLTTGIIKILQEETGKPEGRVGKIQASALNKKDINKLIKKVSGGCLIVENVCELTKKTAVALSLLMEHDTSGMLIIFEDTPSGIEKAFSLDAGLEKKFSEKITVPIFNNDELVAFGKAYCSELGYAIEEMAILALYNRINNIQRLDQSTTISEVKDIIDEAIINERKRSRIKAFSRFSNKKRYTEDNRIILREKDFE
ncbi:tetratricopeptide repeat protein [Lachnobacterium bovis]|uniref:tetratricopeptide repeat protein n=1 Tax=Lachnobacterium bovis TaxID=140626 RepID=UPI000483EEBF|nr:tetratricopeptide repeat protein [Lachnobacterium bovis]